MIHIFNSSYKKFNFGYIYYKRKFIYAKPIFKGRMRIAKPLICFILVSKKMEVCRQPPSDDYERNMMQPDNHIFGFVFLKVLLKIFGLIVL